ncbi:hypothetical protein NNC19_08420 [Clostridium sp. SHJSY1]|uniref:hypothetical protein n=1 Tax=Clostridium sp. SHJSY1 TaxID=2942483 RepID=UPI0028762B9D|nr:hypothetical protein [Clostridium sp. SHJSY1]MDS0525700.1 hypothetical protein [Clostridium sp. SHJSY1]
MKNNNDFNIIENVKNTLNNITLKTDDRGNYVFGFSNKSNLKNTTDDKLVKENENIYSKNAEGTKIDNKHYNNDVNDDYDVNIGNENNDNIGEGYDRKQDVDLESQGVIDSIANELTSARLQQAIILSEIVGKPRSKTRRKRRF